MSTFGDLERAFADLYPDRWAFAAGIIVFLAVLTGYAYRQGWHTILLRHRVKASMIATPALVVTLWLGWSLSSPKPRSTKLFHSSSTPLCRLIWGEKTSKLMPGMAKVESPVESGGAAPSRTPKNPVAGVTTAPGSNETSIQSGPGILKSGEFQDADSFHKSTGAVTIYMGADGTRLLASRTARSPTDQTPRCAFTIRRLG